jgi:hypothetical protein
VPPRALRWDGAGPLPPGLPAPAPVLVLVGGAGGLSERHRRVASRLVDDVLIPAAAATGASVVDGGTDSGLMRLIGRAGSSVPLVGVLVEAMLAGDVDVEVHHTHLVLVPGATWGDESHPLAALAGHLSSGHASVTVLVNGGDVSRDDVDASLALGRPVLVADGTGRFADELADQVRAGSAPPGVALLPADAAAARAALIALLRGTPTGAP